MIDIGTYYGYPQCCIESFMASNSAINFVARHEELPFQDSGFIPCIHCFNTKSPEQLEAEIAERRLCPTPFPDDTGGRDYLDSMRRQVQYDPAVEHFADFELRR